MNEHTHELRIGVGWSVSYRQNWWSRRRYACGNVKLEEAESCARFMRRAGYNRIKIEEAR